MRFSDYRMLVASDLFRYLGTWSWPGLFKHLLLHPGFKYTFWMRTCAFLAGKPALWPLFAPARLMLRRYAYKFGIYLPYRTKVGPGLYIAHFGGVFISGKAALGRNFSITHEVTIAAVTRGRREGAPVIGDGVFVAPGAKILGKVTIGRNVAVGANCVVTRDVPDDAVVVGIPGRVISSEGARGIVKRVWTR